MKYFWRFFLYIILFVGLTCGAAVLGGVVWAFLTEAINPRDESLRLVFVILTVMMFLVVFAFSCGAVYFGRKLMDLMDDEDNNYSEHL